MAIWKGAHPQNFRAGRAGHQPMAIVIHIMDGSLIGTDSWFNDVRSGVSAHYGIGKAGVIHQYVKEVDTAFHAGTVMNPHWPLIKRTQQGNGYVNPNYYTLGVEHEGQGLSQQAWPDLMRQASLNLVAELAARWAIPLDANHIIPHRDIRASKPNCPGHGLDMAAYIAALQGHAPPAVPQPEERAVNLAARLLRTANIRRAPRTDGPELRKVMAGDTFQAVAVIQGEPVSGNPNWFRNAANEHLWAGTTDQPRPA